MADKANQEKGEEMTDSQDQRDEAELSDKERKLRDIRAQIQAIKEQIEQQDCETAKLISQPNRSLESVSTKRVSAQSDSNLQEPAPKRTKRRELETLELVDKFKRKLNEANKRAKSGQSLEKTQIHAGLLDEEQLDVVDSLDWMSHKFEPDQQKETRLAKDANTKDDNWYLDTDEKPERREHRDGHSGGRRYQTSDEHRHSSSHSRSEKKSHKSHHRHRDDRHSRRDHSSKYHR